MECLWLVLTVIVTVAQLRGVHGSSEGAEPTQEFVVHQILEKMSCVLDDLVNQAGSQNNKLKELDYCLESLSGGMKSLSGDAYKITIANNEAAYLKKEELYCIHDHINDTEEELDEIKYKVNAISYTLNEIEGFVHPCYGSGWIKIADFNYINPATPCPGEWVAVSSAPYTIRGCARSDISETNSRDQATFPVYNITYDQVCGRINAYSLADPGAFSPPDTELEENYVDGVSLTHGQPGARIHIWTFAAASAEGASGDFPNECPCDGGADPPDMPDFVRGNFFCEAGSMMPSMTFNGNDLLWDGEMCPTQLCCTRNTPPYFHAYLNNPTSDDIDARILLEHPDDDVSVVTVELYVKPI